MQILRRHRGQSSTSCFLTKSNLQSLDFVINRLFMKLFKTSIIDTVKCCQEYFNFDLPSVLWTKRMLKFEVKFSLYVSIVNEVPAMLHSSAAFICVFVGAYRSIFVYIYICTFIFVYMYLCACVCVCLCVFATIYWSNKMSI